MKRKRGETGHAQDAERETFFHGKFFLCYLPGYLCTGFILSSLNALDQYLKRQRKSIVAGDAVFERRKFTGDIFDLANSLKVSEVSAPQKRGESWNARMIKGEHEKTNPFSCSPFL